MSVGLGIFKACANYSLSTVPSDTSIKIVSRLFNDQYLAPSLEQNICVSEAGYLSLECAGSVHLCWAQCSLANGPAAVCSIGLVQSVDEAKRWWLYRTEIVSWTPIKTIKQRAICRASAGVTGPTI